MKKNLKSGLAVRGYDLVSIVEKKKLRRVYNQLAYSLMVLIIGLYQKKNKQLFIDKPEKYLPQ